jgi:hypothetical protein
MRDADIQFCFRGRDTNRFDVTAFRATLSRHAVPRRIGASSFI